MVQGVEKMTSLGQLLPGRKKWGISSHGMGGPFELCVFLGGRKNLFILKRPEDILRKDVSLAV